MKYIDSEKLKELIDEKRKELADKNAKVGGGKWDAEIYTYLSVLSIIDSIQQNQSNIDLEEEITNQIRLLNGVHTLNDGKQWWKGTYNELTYFAKYFYELGLKTQNSNIGFSNIDIDDTLKEEGIDNDSKEAKIYKEAYFVAIDKAFEKFKNGA